MEKTEKKVYVLVLEVNWHNWEGYEVLGVFSDEEDAKKELNKEKEYFLSKYSDDIDEDCTIVDWRPTYFQCFDEYSGDNYELCVIEQTLR